MAILQEQNDIVILNFKSIEVSPNPVHVTGLLTLRCIIEEIVIKDGGLYLPFSRELIVCLDTPRAFASSS